MIGYKAFDKNLCCRGFQYEVGKTYTKDTKKEDMELRTDKVFHFCRELNEIEKTSAYNLKDSRICEVISGDDIIKEDGRYGTNRITILREITGSEKNDMLNSGDYNSGHHNSGDYNSGNRNSGNYNSGNYNSGNRNSGNYNSGHHNSGDYNSGKRNSGNYNSGDYNSGYCNSGNYNSGHHNSGYCNSGDYNSGHHNSGIFNTDEPKIRMFNKDSNFKFIDINIPSWCFFKLTQFVSYDTATDEERLKYKNEIEFCGGFLRTISYKEAWSRAYSNASSQDVEKLFSLPNFDPDVFLEITGLDLREEFERWRNEND